MNPEPTPVERCLDLGPNALTDTELLAALLSERREDSPLDQARELLNDANGLRGLLAFEGLPGEMETIGSFRTATLLSAIELSRRLAHVGVPEQPMRDRRALINYLYQRYQVIDQEVCGAVYLDVHYRWIADREIFRGSLTGATVEPRAILRYALALGAGRFILFHTHPGSNEMPSQLDREFTQRMAEAGELMGVGLLDHLIIGSDGHWTSAMHKPT